MTESTDALVLDLVEWVAIRPRSYADMMDAWRTSCPRLTIWEDAEEQGLIRREQQAGTGTMISATPLGLERLRDAGRLA